jgi:CDP-6-deoxy-D-xylo-4-hexulose-3-dehydrase
MLNDVPIIDDVCESHGCLSEDYTKVGSDSLGATFSFYYGHHMSTIEGGMISTNNTQLHDLMKMKRSHGMSRFSKNHNENALMNAHINKMFLFMTDGYNFRNTDLGAVLGMSQLKRLDTYIDKRNDNYDRFFDCCYMKYSDNLHRIYNGGRISSFCFPLIFKDRRSKLVTEAKLVKAGIEYRPIVSGNLLKQPYLEGYKISHPPMGDEKYTVDILHNNGIYLGNNHFVTEEHIQTLSNILGEVF